MNRIIALAIVAVLATVSAPGRAQHGATPSGPAAQAISQWFTTDRSLGCLDRQGRDSACTVGDRTVGFEIYYGASTSGDPQADALAFVHYANDPTAANGISWVVAYFHREGAAYRFIKTFPDADGAGLVKGTIVQFLPGKARFSMMVPRKGDAHCCPTGRANYTVTLNDTAPGPRAAGNSATQPAGSAAPSWAVGPAFVVAVSVSPKAAARLTLSKETIKVTEMLYGGYARHPQHDDGGPIALASDTIELAAPGVAHFPGPRYDSNLMTDTDVAGPCNCNQPQVLINVFSGRHSSPNNLLDCDIFQDTITAAARTSIQIHCRLIGEQ